MRAPDYFGLDVPSVGIKLIDGANHNLLYDNLTSGVATDIIIYGSATPFLEIGFILPKTFENVVIPNPGQTVVENLEGDEDPSYGNVLIGVKPVDEAGTALLDDVLKNAGPITEPTVEDFSRVFFTSLSAGLNMIDIPLKPITSYTARSLAESLGATVVIRLNANRQRFEGFTISDAGNGFPIEGGNGYIVNVTESKTVSFVGAAWTNNPPVEIAPSATNRTSAWAFVFSGALSDAGAVGSGYRVSVTNQRTGETVSDTISSDGTFAAVTADLSRKSVVELNDTMEVVVVNAQGKVVSGSYTFKVTPEAIEKAYLFVTLPVNEVIPQKTALWQNYPNPFNPETWIPYSLSTSADVTLQIYDASGQLIRTFAIGHRDAGEYIKPGKAVYWDGRNERGELVSSGVYFYTFQSGSFTASRKMVILK